MWYIALLLGDIVIGGIASVWKPAKSENKISFNMVSESQVFFYD